MDNGLTREQASEILTHLAFYEGWPNVFSAVPVVKEGLRGSVQVKAVLGNLHRLVRVGPRKLLSYGMTLRNGNADSTV
jgi:Carboxymuconolactone decarboxylase family